MLCTELGRLGLWVVSIDMLHVGRTADTNLCKRRQAQREDYRVIRVALHRESRMSIGSPLCAPMLNHLGRQYSILVLCKRVSR